MRRMHVLWKTQAVLTWDPGWNLISFTWLILLRYERKTVSSRYEINVESYLGVFGQRLSKLIKFSTYLPLQLSALMAINLSNKMKIKTDMHSMIIHRRLYVGRHRKTSFRPGTETNQVFTLIFLSRDEILSLCWRPRWNRPGMSSLMSTAPKMHNKECILVRMTPLGVHLL